MTGGLGFAGGPGNNYVSHSIATMAEPPPGRSRLGRDSSPVSAGTSPSMPSACGRRRPRRPASATSHPQDEVDALPQARPASDYEGDATVETYTVVHERDGEPELAIVALLTDDGPRAWGTLTDVDTLASLEIEEGCGRRARVAADGRAELR